jgi:hypothetical protein
MTGSEEKIRRCVICGSTRRVEANHVGGRNFVAWFTGPLCGDHHDRFHVLLRQMRLDLRYTPDPVERAIRVLKAILVFAWMVLEGLHYAVNWRKGDQ